MDSNRNNNQGIPEIMPEAASGVRLPKTPSRLQLLKRKLEAWWVKLRYGRRPRLSWSSASIPRRVSMPSSGSVAYLKRYWWAVVVVILLVGGVVGWWYIGHQREQSWVQATDFYRRADYQSAAPILLNLPLPDDAERLRIYGQTMQATNHPDKAVAAYQKLYEKEKDPYAKLSLGNVYNQQQNYDEAIKAYQELIDSNPNYVQAYVNLATVYRLQGNNAEALRVARDGLQNNANSVVVAELMVSLTAENPESSEYKEAVETLRRINPNDPLLP